MLLRFRCKNFRSIRTELSISLVAANTRSNEHNGSLIETSIERVRGLRCAAIYGPNASGKSNILKAMSSFRSTIQNSQKKWDETDGNPNWEPFRLDDVSENEETEFEADVLINSIRYRYGFRCNKTSITGEWLIEHAYRERTLFRRSLKGDEISIEFPGRNLSGQTLETIKQLTRPNSLFLSAAAQNNVERLKEIHAWFVERFWIVSPMDRGLGFTATAIFKEGNLSERMKNLLRLADVGIADVEVTEEEYSENDKKYLAAVFRAMKESSKEDVVEPPPSTHLALKLLHRGAANKLYRFTENEESAGTLRFFAMLGPILTEIEQGSILLVDELESSLHPLLLNMLIHIFNSPKTNPKGAQIIFTTHNLGVMEGSALRRDQIWFTEKQKGGDTVLYPLSSFKPRKDQKLAAGYLHGRFGAVPFIDVTEWESALEFSEPRN